jgi:hypothetical protein
MVPDERYRMVRWVQLKACRLHRWLGVFPRSQFAAPVSFARPCSPGACRWGHVRVPGLPHRSATPPSHARRVTIYARCSSCLDSSPRSFVRHLVMETFLCRRCRQQDEANHTAPPPRLRSRAQHARHAAVPWTSTSCVYDSSAGSTRPPRSLS